MVAELESIRSVFSEGIREPGRKRQNASEMGVNPSECLPKRLACGETGENQAESLPERPNCGGMGE